MSANLETVTDIVAKMRREADRIVASAEASVRDGETMAGTPYSSAEFEAALDRAMTIRSEADRLEAALKRELATTKESLVVGNAAKLREALITLRENLHVEKIDGCACGPTYIGPTVCAFTLIDAALAAPPRNCDVGTAEEQTQRFDQFCHKNRTMEKCCGDCPALGLADCEFIWAQMPYES